METVGQRIKYIRVQAGLTKVALAKKAGIAPSYLTQAEKDQRIPTGTILFKLAKCLGINFEWLMTGEGEITLVGTSEEINVIQSVSFELGVPQKLLVSLVNAYKGGEKEKYEFVKEFIKTTARSKAENVIS